MSLVSKHSEFLEIKLTLVVNRTINIDTLSLYVALVASITAILPQIASL